MGRQKKICSICKKPKQVSEFHRRRHYVRSGHRAACKECTREATRTAREQKERERERTDNQRLKARVRRRTRDAIEQGTLLPLPCHICGHVEVEPHHPRYDDDDAHLIVDWLCKKHHALAHGKRPWTKQLELFPSSDIDESLLFEEEQLQLF